MRARSLRIHPVAKRRTAAYAVDAFSYLGVALATVPLGFFVRAVVGEPSRPLVLALSAIPPVIATLWAAYAEASPAGATWGKRWMGLRVVTEPGRGRLSFRDALGRNIIKIGLPWQLGHTVAVGAAFGGFDDGDPLTIAATAITYPLLAVMVGMVVLGPGRGLHDRVAHSLVVVIDKGELDPADDRSE